jgi:hypothetical protein
MVHDHLAKPLGTLIGPSNVFVSLDNLRHSINKTDYNAMFITQLYDSD